MKRLLYLAANVTGGLVIVLLAVDPGRPLAPIFALCGLAVVLALLPRFLRK